MNFNYGLRECTCRICKKQSLNKVYTVKEMMYGTREEFPYFVCEGCKCMQIMHVPEDLGKYYRNNYYSMNPHKNVEFETDIVHEEKILDVGCGSGAYLIELANKGYGKLYGCDPFIEDDIKYGDRIYIYKCDITEMEGKYDKIRFADSFEHISNPLENLKSVKRLLKKEGECYIDLPIFPNAAFDVFGTNWYQIDAPRHIFVHSRESIKFLCDKVGLKVEKITYNSNQGQFIYSYLYELGIPYLEQIKVDIVREYLTPETYNYFSEAVDKVNKKEYGDHAYIILKHVDEEKKLERKGV